MFNRIILYIKKERFILLLSLIIGFMIYALLSVKTYSEEIMKSLNSEVFRFHVVANSDSPADQTLKLLVRDGILSQYKNELDSSLSKEETKEFFISRLPEIRAKAEEIIKEEDFNYSVTTEVGKSRFPTKKYGDVTLPAGEYDCLKIIIGEGAGHNWWCVMFPPLCYVDETYEESEENRFKDDFDPEAYEVILGDGKNASPEIKIKLKTVELWQEFKEKQKSFHN